MPITVSSYHTDFHFAFDTRTKSIFIRFDTDYYAGFGIVSQRPYWVIGYEWRERPSGLHKVRLPEEIEDQIYTEFMRVKPYLPEIRYHLKTVVQKELFEK